MRIIETLERPTTTQPEKAVKWRNVYWTTDGRKGTGLSQYNTQQQADNAAIKFAARNKEVLAMGKTHTVNCLEGQLLKFVYSWHLQIPILQE